MAASQIFCGHCGAQNPASRHFCFSCGDTLSASITPAPASSTLTGQLPAQTLLRQRYRVLQVVGQGGMGAIYLAQDTSLGDRPVAIKEMSQSNNQQAQEAITNFKHEAYLLASLQHPNLPTIYDHFEESGHWYLVMSFIQGETLEDYLSHTQDKKLPLDEVLHIGEDLCNVLNYLHTHQPPIIFRDLKPANIMRNTHGHIYLIDFGIARHFKPGQAKDTANYGSAGYAPPEQYGKTQTTVRSDIYSLGVTLYEMLSGYDPSQSPFRFPPLQSLVPTLPERLVKLITRMLEIDESKRPPSIKAVQQEVQQIAVPVPSVARQHMSLSSIPTPKRTTPPLYSSSQAIVSPGAQLHLARSTKGVSRRKMIVGLAGLAIVGGGIIWRANTHDSASPQTPSHVSSPLLFTYTGHTEDVTAVAWSLDGKRIASGDMGGTVQVWDAANGHNILTFHGVPYVINTVAWSPDGKRIASGGGLSALQVWDAVDGHNVFNNDHQYASQVISLAWSPDSKSIASGGNNGGMQVWDVTDGHTIYELATGSDIVSVAWSPNGKWIAGGKTDNTVQVWDAANGRTILTYTGQSDWVDVAWSPNSKYIASTGGSDGKVQVWDAANGHTILTYNGQSYAGSVAWSPDGKHIASGGYDGTVQVWDAANGHTIITYDVHAEGSINPSVDDHIQSVAWSPDGKRIASGGGDSRDSNGTVQIWKAP